MRVALIAIAVVALILVGFFFFGGASPAIIVAPEVVFHWGPLDVTNTMFTSWIVVAGMIIVAFIAGRGVSVVPSGFSGAVEAAVVALYDIVVGIAGEANGRRFFPLIGTIFFFILISNYSGLLPINNVIGLTEPGVGDKQAVLKQTDLPLLGTIAYIPFNPEQVDVGSGDEPYQVIDGEVLPLEEHGAEDEAADDDHASAVFGAALVSSAPGDVNLGGGAAVHEEGHEGTGTVEEFSGIIAPYFRSVMTDVNTPLAIALFSFIFVEFWGLSTLGVSYLGKFFAFGALKKGPAGIIDVFVGLLEFISELSRIISFTFRLFGNIFAGEVLLLMMTFLVPFVLADIFYALELFVGLIQAFVFAILTLVFAVSAVTAHGGDHDEEAAPAPAPAAGAAH
jgi:F-type H+-transporting ATPase subunit a